ncbi:flavin reductase family protein [Clostridium tetani]|uniref:flavin reductase family protein n=1 Tax=Clostridium tetani TaxID=1513 RepID=UPI00100AC004|nr:flavin reductase family protein [Clostridium tetani]RXM58056.1 flavin reductase family protein [Clostridium tetani]RXM79268.1 flavin reductase family protein [Clostridium tetani]RYV00080.1 flavin reductase family protein [Clostridium tetani]
MKFEETLGRAIDLIKEKGAFLTIKDDDKVNTMTIGWANIGYQWRIPIFSVMVRKSRYTYELIEKASEFTVSIPVDVNLKKELTFCGSKSGRDVDKIKECNLKLEKGKKIETPIIDNCEMHFECKILYKEAMVKENLSEDIKDKFYKDGDYHTFYYAEILDCYIK